jgi:hypothetical protein
VTPLGGATALAPGEPGAVADEGDEEPLVPVWAAAMLLDISATTTTARTRRMAFPSLAFGVNVIMQAELQPVMPANDDVIDTQPGFHARRPSNRARDCRTHPGHAFSAKRSPPLIKSGACFFRIML